MFISQPKTEPFSSRVKLEFPIALICHPEGCRLGVEQDGLLALWESVLGEPNLTSQAVYSAPNWKIGGGPLNRCESLCGLANQDALITNIQSQVSGGDDFWAARQYSEENIKDSFNTNGVPS